MAYRKSFRRIRIIAGSAMWLAAAGCVAEVVVCSWVLPSYLERAPKVSKAIGMIWCTEVYLFLFGAFCWVLSWIVEGFFQRADPTLG
jgi:hypothetical protein